MGQVLQFPITEHPRPSSEAAWRYRDICFGLLMTDGQFRDDRYRLIFDAMIHLYLCSEPIDLMTVSEELRLRGQLEEIGGAAALVDLVLDDVEQGEVS